MSDSLRIVRRWYEERDTTLLHPDISWQVLAGFPGGGAYRGRDAVVDGFFPAVIAAVADVRAMPERFVAAGDTPVVIGRYVGRRHDGRSFDVPFAHLWKVGGGAIISFAQITDTAPFSTGQPVDSARPNKV